MAGCRWVGGRGLPRWSCSAPQRNDLDVSHSISGCVACAPACAVLAIGGFQVTRVDARVDVLVLDIETQHDRVGLAEPETTKDPVGDAAIAAVVAWRLRDEQLPTSAWVDARSRLVPERRGLGVSAADPIPPDSEVPEEFAKRGLLVWRDTFASV